MVVQRAAVEPRQAVEAALALDHPVAQVARCQRAEAALPRLAGVEPAVEITEGLRVVAQRVGGVAALLREEGGEGRPPLGDDLGGDLEGSGFCRHGWPPTSGRR